MSLILKLLLSGYFSIADLKGRRIYSRRIQIKGAVNHFAWNQTSDNGVSISAGRYIGKFQKDSLQASTLLLLN